MKLNLKLAARISILVSILAFTLFPIYWMVITSFKGTYEFTQLQTYFPVRPTLYLWSAVLKPGGVYLHSFQNSVLISSTNTLLCLLAGLPAAYAFSRGSFVGKDHLFFWLLSNRMAPTVSFMVPYFAIYTSLGLYNNISAVILAHTLFNLPLGIWIMKGYVDDIPTSIDEQAFIDGHGLAGFFRRIFIPLMAAGIGVSAFFMFIFSWSELLLANTLSGPDSRPLIVYMRGLGAGGANLLSCLGVLSMLPGVVLLLFVYKYMSRGFAFGRV